MRKFRFLILLLLLPLLLPAGLAESGDITVTPPQGAIRPGRAVLLTFAVEDAGVADVLLEREDGTVLSVVVRGMSTVDGVNRLWWNGTYNGVNAPAGDALLVVRQGGDAASAPVTIGHPAPFLTSFETVNLLVTPSVPMQIRFYSSEPGTVSVTVEHDGARAEVASADVEEGVNTVWWDGLGFTDGAYAVGLQLTDSEGDQSDRTAFSVTLTGFDAAAHEELDASFDLVEDVVIEEPAVQNDQSQYTPSYGSPYAGQDTSLNYWTMPMDITDEKAVWAMLTAPMTIVDSGAKNAQRAQVTIRKEPSMDAPGVGVVTCVSQGVHVLERGEEWSLIECYSSSFHDSKVKAWNMLVQGYVPTKYLKTVEPRTDYGIVIDKLTQRLYLFVDGHLYSTLLVSTGLANPRQPYNETRSGEFLLVSPVGEFRSDSLYCSMALRHNSGDLLHEVPHTKNRDGSSNYTKAEAKLGTKASHGCIRVQRRRDPNGVCMKWLWDNRKMRVRLVIWEDWQGRQIPYPGDDTVLYYNPGAGKNYHSSDTCYSAVGKTFTPFTYGELDTGEFAKLDRCQWCTPPLRKAEIDEINTVYAPGGDHDPVMTAAREKLDLP